jgi:hypothetical protein
MQRHRQLEWNAAKTDAKGVTNGAPTGAKGVTNGAPTGAQAALSPRLLLAAALVAVLQGAVLARESSSILSRLLLLAAA